MTDQTAKSPISLHTDFCEYAINAALRAVNDLMDNDGERPHILAFGLYATILELASGALSLAQLQRYAGLPVLLRSIYEAHLDLQNLLRDADYSLNMEAADAEEQLKLVIEAETNKFLAGTSFNAKSELDRLRARLAELRALGRRPLTIKQRAILVGRQEQYASSYRLLCLDGHNNTSALADRHFTEIDGERFVNFFGEPCLTESLRSYASLQKQPHQSFQLSFRDQ